MRWIDGDCGQRYSSQISQWDIESSMQDNVFKFLNDNGLRNDYESVKTKDINSFKRNTVITWSQFWNGTEFHEKSKQSEHKLSCLLMWKYFNFYIGKSNEILRWFMEQ